MVLLVITAMFLVRIVAATGQDTIEVICPGQTREIQCEEDEYILIMYAVKYPSPRSCNEQVPYHVDMDTTNFTQAYRRCSDARSCVLTSPVCQRACTRYQVSYMCISSSPKVPSGIMANTDTDSDSDDSNYLIFIVSFTLGAIIVAGVVVSIVIIRKIIRVRAELRNEAPGGVGNLRQSLRTLNFWRRVLSRRNSRYVRNPHISPPPPAPDQPPGSPGIATEWMTIGQVETMGSTSAVSQSTNPLTPSDPTLPGTSTTSSPGVATEWMTIAEVENLRESTLDETNETRTISGNLTENYRYLVHAAP